MTATNKSAAGIVCPNCNCSHLPVRYTRHRGNRTIRYRECRHCGKRVITYEEIQRCTSMPRKKKSPPSYRTEE